MAVRWHSPLQSSPLATGKPLPTIYCDSIRLKWSARGASEPCAALDLPHGANQFIDLVSTRSTSKDYRPELEVHLNRYRNLFAEHGTLLFTVLVTSDDATPQTIKVKSQWAGDWDRFIAD